MTCRCRGHGFLHPRRGDGSVNWAAVIPCGCGGELVPVRTWRPSGPTSRTPDMAVSDAEDYP